MGNLLTKELSTIFRKRIFIQTFQRMENILKVRIDLVPDGMIRHWKNWSGGIERIGEI